MRCGARDRAPLHPPGPGLRPPRQGRPLRRGHADRLRQDPLLQPARPRRHPERPRRRALYLFPTKALAQDQLAELQELARGPARQLRDPHLRRRHAPGRAPRGPRAGQRRAHQPRHAPLRHPAAPHQLGRGSSRTSATSSSTSCTPTAASSAATWPTSSAGCAASAASTARRPSSSAPRPPSPTPRSWPSGSSAQPVEPGRRERRARPARSTSSSTTRRSSTAELGIRAPVPQGGEPAGHAVPPRPGADDRLRPQPAGRGGAADRPQGRRRAGARRSRTSIRGYRGGYLPNRRREIERGLRDGRHPGRRRRPTRSSWASTSAAWTPRCWPATPGTVASTWQQAGRAGRRSGLSPAVLVASSAPARPVHRRPPRLLLRQPARARADQPRQPLHPAQPPQVRRLRAARSPTASPSATQTSGRTSVSSRRRACSTAPAAAALDQRDVSRPTTSRCGAVASDNFVVIDTTHREWPTAS